jgi:cysteine desulfurase/selenocysteine lyase
MREDFPGLVEDIVYLDNGATSHKPNIVLDAMDDFYVEYNANVHRGAHRNSVEATDRYEQAREKVTKFLNASSPREIIFTKGTTEGINIIAQSFVNNNDIGQVLVTDLEHHANIVPWHLIDKTSYHNTLQVIKTDKNSNIDLDHYRECLHAGTINSPYSNKFVSICHVSNVTGSILPIKEMIAIAHEYGFLVCIDGAQAVPHFDIDVQDLDVDFYAFSGHKMYGPTGIGVLYGKEAYLNDMLPYQGGGDMIKEVSWEGTIYNDLPYKFEAGTPNIAGVIGLGAAVDYLNSIDREKALINENECTELVFNELEKIDRVKILSRPDNHVGAVSFEIKDAHFNDVAVLLDAKGIAVRSGHHCAQPLHTKHGCKGSVRASFGLYNTICDVTKFIEALKFVIGKL